MDGVDVAVVDFATHPPAILATHKEPILPSLKQKIKALCQPNDGNDGVARLGATDVELGHVFAQAALTGLRKTTVAAKNINAIGSHGQTIRHMPNGEAPFTIQIADPNIIALRTGITTVADFRRRDIAAGGQGAPLAPAFHHFLFNEKNKNRIIVNIGGIANLTVLNQKEIIGFDTGPGNTLLDAWSAHHSGCDYDHNGSWARTGKIISTLLAALLDDAYFKKAYPKSTGIEYFNLIWLKKFLTNEKPQDVQATLTALSAVTIANAVKPFHADEIILCGGGVHNHYLTELLQQNCANAAVVSSEEVGVHPDWIEAIGFAWLAKQTIENQPGNIPSVTGAKQKTILGGIYPSNIF